ncbi:MAG: hypothetical protein HY508_15415 [Acidobacteria bacterium]|nr:hypothetical protein [Acidobacteriota bacterium]
MNRRRRKLVTRIVEAFAVSLVTFDLVLYLALVRPLKNLQVSAENEYSATRSRIQEGKGRVARLEQYRVDVPKSETELKEFLTQHVPDRRQGFSHAARLVRKMSEDSKVRLTSVSYKLSGQTDSPLARLGLEFDVEGSFPDVLRFTHALETSGDFLRVRSFSLTPAETRTIAMHVGAELYLKP